MIPGQRESRYSDRSPWIVEERRETRHGASQGSAILAMLEIGLWSAWDRGGFCFGRIGAEPSDEKIKGEDDILINLIIDVESK